MAEVVIDLSTKNIRALRDNMKRLARELRDDVKVDIEQKVGAAIADDVMQNIAGISDVDGNYLGHDEATVLVLPTPSTGGHRVAWFGKQIAYLEFGTGAVGQGYPGAAMAASGYHPDPTKDAWHYKDAKSGQYERSTGLPWQGPMFNAAIRGRMTGKTYAIPILREAVQRAVTL